MSGTPRSSARQRLLDAADDLFYAEGIQSVGIDRVIERAGVAKASLYRSFASKDELVAAYLDARHERNLKALNEALDRKATPTAKLLGIFKVQAGWLSAKDYRGCPFTRASAEAPEASRVQEAIDAYRSDIRDLLTEQAQLISPESAKALVVQLEVLFHGSAVLVTFESRQQLASAMRAAAATLVDAAASTHS